MTASQRAWLAVLGAALFLTLAIMPLGTAVRDGPTIQVVGHQIPLSQAQDATVGRGAGADVRLDEALIADRLGSLSVQGTEVHYQHEAAHRGALVTRREDLSDDVFGARLVPDGDRVVVLSGLDGVDAAARSAELQGVCASEANEGGQGTLRWARVRTVDAVGVWITQGDAVSTVLVPDVAGQEQAIGSAVLRRGESLELVADETVFEVPSVFVRQVPDAIAEALRSEPAFSDAPIDAGRVVKDRAWLVVGDQAPVPVQPGGLAASTFELGDGHAVFLFRRGPGGETIKPWFVPVDAALGVFAGPAPLQVARTPDRDASVHVFDCQELPACIDDGEGCPAEVGVTTLADGDWLVAGAGVHYRVELAFGTPQDEGELQLALALPPSGRVRLLSSLSAGRLQAWGPRVDVPACSGDDAGRLVLRGTTEESVLPEGVDAVPGRFVRAAADSLMDVPMPRWFARQLPEVVDEGVLDVPLSAVCSREDGLVLRALRDGGVSARVPPGETFELAGHTYRYWDHQPTREQRIPLAGFLFGMVAFCMLALREWTGVATRGGQAPLPIPGAVALGAVAVLLSAGAALQMHMAASDALLGSPDYVQRHLITSYGAAVVLWLGIRLGHSWRREGFWALTRKTLRTLALGALGLAIWASLDWGLWRLVGPPLDQVPADAIIEAAVVRSIVAVWAVAGVLAAGAFGAGRLVDGPGPTWAWTRAASALFGRVAQRNRALGFLLERPAGEDRGFGRAALVTGLVVLVVGAGLDVVVGSRWLAGFDLKPAEFTPTLIGLGIAGLLAGFSREQSSDWWRVPARALGWIGIIGGLLLLCYGARADLGPLMVIVPSVVGMLAVWAFPWSPAQRRKGRVAVRLAVFGLTLLALSLFVEGFVLVTEVFQDQVTEIPRVGRSIERAIDRFATYQNTWYTTPGWWSTRAHWIAAGFYGDGREVYLSNLHSDLAYIALMQSWGLRRALLVLALFGLLAGGLIAAGEHCIDAAGGLVRRVARHARDLPGALGDAMGERAEGDARRWAAIGYFCYFAAFYVVSEIVVHVGTCFNTLPQTGITMPWVSSGGSAAIGFALLVGVALGLVARARAEVLAGDDLAGRQARAQEVLDG